MNDSARGRVGRLLASCGDSVWSEPARLRTLLADAGAALGEVEALVAALEEGVPHALRCEQADSGGNDSQRRILFRRLSNRVSQNRGIAKDAARWAAETWGLAVGVAPPAPPQPTQPSGVSSRPVGDEILTQFQRRLAAATSRSPLLRLRMSPRGRLLDCSRLSAAASGLPEKLLRSIVDGRSVTIDLDRRAVASGRRYASFSPGEPASPGGPAIEQGVIGAIGAGLSPSPDELRIAQQTELYDLLDRRMRRHAELAARETGVHTLWLGYPLIFYSAAGHEDDHWALAPAFLWPLSITLDHRHEGRLRLERADAAGRVQVNRALAAWAIRRLGLQLEEPADDALENLDWASLPELVESLRLQFRDLPGCALQGPLSPIPAAQELRKQGRPAMLHAAVLGYFRWQNEAILADLEKIREAGPLGGAIAALSPAHRGSAEVPPSPSEADRYLTLDADFSQQRVVWRARSSQGLVVHGPPGTGKSQTIANVICDALAHEKTVLMVCQKHAATRIVLENLRQAGVGELCLEIRDAEKDRIAVFKAIRQQVDQLSQAGQETGAADAERRRAALAEQITALEQELDDFARALHEPHPQIGVSYLEARAHEGRLHLAQPGLRPSSALASLTRMLSAAELDAAGEKLDTLEWLFRQSEAWRNPWKHRRGLAAPPPLLREDVGRWADALRQADRAHQQAIAEFGAGWTLAAVEDGWLELSQRLVASCRQVLGDPPTLAALRCFLTKLADQPGAGQSLRSTCREALALSEKVRAAPLSPECHALYGGRCLESLRELTLLCGQLARFRRRPLRWVSPGYFALARRLQSLHPPCRKAMWPALDELAAYLEGRKLRAELANMHRSLAAAACPGDDDETAQLAFSKTAQEALVLAEWLVELQSSHPWAPLLVEAVLNEDAQRLGAALDSAEQSLARAPLARAVIEQLAPLAEFLEEAALAPPTSLALAGAPLANWLDSLENGLDALESLIAFEAESSRLPPPLRGLLDQLAKSPEPTTGAAESQVDAGGWKNRVLCSALAAWRDRWHEEHPLLSTLSPESHRAKAEELARRLDEKRALESDAILGVWRRRQRSRVDQPWRRVFQLRRSRYGESRRLREAIAIGLPLGLLDLRPCWLVSPSAASQVLPLAPGLFDLVIFDEASQCPVEQAAPSMFRGKTLLISGDEKQLPPTSFFSPTAEIDEPWRLEGRLDAEDSPADADSEASDAPVARSCEQLHRAHLLEAEDLLSAVVGALPEEQLRVHYRSRHPALVEFSNQAFYSGALESPPSVSGCGGDQTPIDYQHVIGEYRHRTNVAEAKRVVEIVKELWRGGSSPTVGVVTFNQPQRELIEDLLEEECERDAEFASRYECEIARRGQNQDVGFFVKNLENVQGDERDLMIFSTTFSADASGRFYRRFGPVGAVGGERRLNVAVTRAKVKVIVVGGMPLAEISDALGPEPVDPEALTPKCYLQLYLAYALAVSRGDQAAAERVLARLSGEARQRRFETPRHSPLADDVQKAIEEMGYTVQRNVGDGGFSLALAVRRREGASGYLLGIDCDGAAWLPGRGARLREVWRTRMLIDRGWRLHRLWSARWWYHRQREIDRLKQALAEAECHSPTTAAQNPDRH